MRSKEEQARLYELDKKRAYEILCKVDDANKQLEWNKTHPNPNEGLIDLYSERNRKTPDPAGEVDVENFQTLDLYTQRMKRDGKPLNSGI